VTYTQDDLEDLVAPSEGAPGSLLERLRQQRDASKPQHLDLLIPGWGAETGGVDIIARMKRIPWRGKAASALRKIQAERSSEQAELDAESDLLIEGLDQLYARDGEKIVPLGEREPLRFDIATAEALGIPARTAREVVCAIFGGDVGEFALKAAAARYVAWLQGVEVVTEDEGNA
jgi:hypothetical protein